jgi:hypothetical protein
VCKLTFNSQPFSIILLGTFLVIGTKKDIDPNENCKQKDMLMCCHLKVMVNKLQFILDLGLN